MKPLTMRNATMEKLKGAVKYMHPTRGMVWKLEDGSFLSQAEYKKLLRQCWSLWLGNRP